MSKNGDKDDEAMEHLVMLLFEGKAKIVDVRIRVCGTCKIGTLISKPTPNWMNRWVCDHCGKKVSR